MTITTNKEIIIDANKEKQEFNEFINKQKRKQSEFKKDKIPVSKYNSRILTQENMHTIETHMLKIFHNEIIKERAIAQEELKKTAQQIFESGEFMKNFETRTNTRIDEEISSKVVNNDFHLFIKNTIETYIKDNLKDIIDKIVISLVKDINNKLTKDYIKAKELTYSINAEIRHTLMKLPISSGTEEIIKTKINNLLSLKEKQQNAQKLIAEDKKQ